MNCRTSYLNKVDIPLLFISFRLTFIRCYHHKSQYVINAVHLQSGISEASKIIVYFTVYTNESYDFFCNCMIVEIASPSTCDISFSTKCSSLASTDVEVELSVIKIHL